MEVLKSSLRLYASPKAVIANFLHLPGNSRVQNIIERVKKLSEQEVARIKNELFVEFGNRHRDIEKILIGNFEKVASIISHNAETFSIERKLVTGAFFSKEYSIQAAALFNPSIVMHPDQTGLSKGEQRFIMSLRATGEGHISSIVFKTGTVDDDMSIRLDEDSKYYTVLKKSDRLLFSKDFIQSRIKNELPYNFIPDELSDECSSNEILKKLRDSNIDATEIMSVFDSNYDLESVAIPLNEKVIFPTAAIESMGMEDVRFVRFEDENGQQTYYGTYTAYNGKEIKTQLIETSNFESFKIRTLYGKAVADKGMALFPEKVNGKYVMISRQGGEKINIMFSENIYFWDSFQTLLEPKYEWEFVQLGNCGSPIKTAEGWLLLIHGVGPFRTYVISTILLDLDDPTVIKSRLDKPLIQADENEREGYVPNVVYTCGLLRHNNFLLIPYAVSDSATGFITVRLQELINEMKPFES